MGNRIFLKRRFWFLLLILPILSGGFLLWKKNTPTSRPADDYQSWQELKDKTSSWLSQADYENIRKIESLVLNETPSAKAAHLYAAVALNCAKARIKGKYGDPYIFLQAAENVINSLSDATGKAELAFQLASEYSRIHCFRRAYNLLQPIPEQHSSESLRALRQRLYDILALFRTTTMHLNFSEKDSITSSLIDLLGNMPQNGAYTEQTQVNAEFKHEAEAALLATNEKALTSDLPLAVSTLMPPKRVPPYPLSVGDVTETEAQAETEDDDQFNDEPVSSIPLSPDENKRLFALLRAKTKPTLESVKRNPLIPTILNKGPRNFESSLYTTNDLKNVFALGNSLALMVSNGELYFFIFSGATVDTVQVSVLGPFGEASRYRMKEINGDGVEDLIISFREGSGSFLDVTAFDLAHPSILLSIDDLSHGDVAFINIDNDAPLEVIAHERTSLSRSMCLQCPARYLATVFDFDKTKLRYQKITRKVTYGEFQLMQGNDFLTGVPAVFDVETGDTYVDSQLRIRKILYDLSKLETNKWTEDLRSELAYRIAALQAVDESSLVLSKEKADLQGEVVSTLNRADLPADWLSLRRNVALLRIQSSIHLGEYEKALNLSAEPWLSDHADKEFRSALSNTVGILNLTLGQMSAAYDAYIQALNDLGDSADSSADGKARIEGNLSLYFRTLSDFRTSYSYALKSLDHAVVASNEEADNEPSGSDGDEAVDSNTVEEENSEIYASESEAFAMMNLAAAAFFEGRHSESLDWIGRAVRVGRSSFNSAILVGGFEIAANIALLHDQPRLALKLLDEALCRIDEGTWRTDGGNMLLLYAKAMAKRNDPKSANALFRASAALSKNVNTSTHVVALYELSRSLSEANDSKAAYEYARAAFEGIALGRRSVRLEEQKFSFLADKRAIASWFFELMIQQNATASELLDAVESWKMRTFIDLHDENNQFANAVPVSQLGPHLLNLLDTGDLFLDYVVLGKSHFVVALSKTTGATVYSLNTTEKVLHDLRDQVQLGVDIRNSESLAAIRADRVNGNFEQALRQLHNQLLGSITIPEGTKRLIIAPDEALFGIPWAALKSNHQDYVGDKYEIVLVPSAAIAFSVGNKARTQQPPESARALIVCSLQGVTASEIEAERSAQSSIPATDLAPLASGWNECQRVAAALARFKIELLADTETLRKQRVFDSSKVANREHLLERAQGARIIHIVAHGLFDSKFPMRSELFLDKGASGRAVRAADFSTLNLRDVNLVTLASCQTGQATAMAGSEPLGFLRALLGAGASSALLSTWEVDDRTTTELLSGFYEQVETERKSQALRDAQQKIRQLRQHPYFWAGQTLYGYWN